MANPAVIIVAGVVMVAAVFIAVFASSSARPQATSYGRHSPPPFVPPPSPPPSFTRKRVKRRKSNERQSNSPSLESTERQGTICTNCGESPYVKIYPCNHESLCKHCFATHVETNDTCPACNGRIDSCKPTIPPFGKCKRCRKFTKLLKFPSCNHFLSLCISCFEAEGKSYKVCPECRKLIRSNEPKTSGICMVCQEFTQFAMFQPCGHGNYCRKHAELFLKLSEQECSECGKKVEKIL